MASRREQLERDEMLQNRIIYSLPTRMGNWNEQLALREYETAMTKYKKQHCGLVVQKVKQIFHSVLKPTSLAVEAPYVKFGLNYQLKTLDSASPDANSLYLSCLLNETDIDAIQHFYHGCCLSASPLRIPCVRNTFRLRSATLDEVEQQVFYGRDILIEIYESGDGQPLYLRCENPSIDTFGEHRAVRLSKYPDIYCRFKFLHWNPKKRHETMDTAVIPDTTVIIQHVASGQNLAVEPQSLIPKFYGTECLVTCHTYRDTHKMESVENFWSVVSRPISDTALYVRAAKGENINVEQFDD
nr:unnamed protein product [Callosobruchus chinensis]